MLLLLLTPTDAPDLRAALESAGAVVERVSDLQAALMALQTRPFEALLVDLAVAGPPDALARDVRRSAPSVTLVGLSTSLDDEITLLSNGFDDGVPADGADEAASSLLTRLSMRAGADDHTRDLERRLALSNRELTRSRQQLTEVTSRAVEAQKMAGVLGLIRGVCHELNNPLTGILGYAQLLQETTDGSTLEDIKEIEVCAQRCRELVARLARFARAEQSDIGPVDVNALADETLQFVEYVIKRGRIKTLIEVSPDLPRVAGLAHELRHAVLAVLVNAVQAMAGQKGGTLTVRTLQVDDHIHLRVTDSGAGIAPEHFERIFDPFFTTRNAADSPGLGLSVAHAIVAAHQGAIEVDSPTGGGTTVTLVLPLRHALLSADPLSS